MSPPPRRQSVSHACPAAAQRVGEQTREGSGRSAALSPSRLGHRALRCRGPGRRPLAPHRLRFSVTATHGHKETRKCGRAQGGTQPNGEPARLVCRRRAVSCDMSVPLTLIWGLSAPSPSKPQQASAENDELSVKFRRKGKTSGTAERNLDKERTESEEHLGRRPDALWGSSSRGGRAEADKRQDGGRGSGPDPPTGVSSRAVTPHGGHSTEKGFAITSLSRFC